MGEKYDFSGWATRTGILCSDGRTIMPEAFKECDGKRVPIVWNHQHSDPDNVLGHGILKCYPQGVRIFGKFNESKKGQDAKGLVDCGDITGLSIYANELRHNALRGVVHGNIREVSLVIAGANPGAYIDTVLSHGDTSEEEGIIYTDESISLDELEHSDESENTDEDNTIAHSTNNEGDDKMAETTANTEGKEETVKDVLDTMNEKQKKVLYALIGAAIEEKEENKEDSGMKHNVFDNDSHESDEVLTHSDEVAIIGDMKRYGSLSESVLAHGITNIGYLYPDNKAVADQPELIKRDTDWVASVFGGASHKPFARIKSLAADLTPDDARALGYTKGNLKKNEVFALLKRTTDPTTIYKKQKIDRDDLIDIKDFNTVAFIKSEMRLMLNEEIARAILISDGRVAGTDDKIDESHIRPIWTDNELYTINVAIPVTEDDTEDSKAKAFIKACIKARKQYKGSGSPALYLTEDLLTEMLLLTDSIGRDLYDSVDKLATKLRVSSIKTVPVMENKTRTVSGKTRTLAGIIVNMKDYTIGADKGGEINMFDDFDIDYNAEKYLIETRISGALTKPYSAIAVEFEASADEDDENVGGDPEGT